MSDIRGFVDLVEREGQLARVFRPVSRMFEVAAVTARADGGPAVLFEDVRDSRFRMVANLVGTRDRFARAIGSDSDIHGTVARALGSPRPPARVADAPFLQNSARTAAELPVVTHFEKESGPFITSSMAHVKNPETGKQNSSFHRLMPIDDRRFSIRMVEGRHLDRCFQSSRERGEDLRVCISIGVHPAVSIAGAYQHAWGEDEMDIANSLLGGGLEVSAVPDTGILVPSHSEIVLAGRVLRDDTHPEWMVEMLRTYDYSREQPVFELDRMYFRTDPLYHDILSGYGEHRLLMGMPIESKISAELRRTHPQVGTIHLTDGGCNWLHAVIQVGGTGNPKEIIRRAFEIHRSLKQVVLVDADIDPASARQVEYAMATRFQADRDLVILEDVRGSSLDPSSDQANLKTAKMGIDATRPAGRRQEGFELARIPGFEACDTNSYFEI